MKATKIWKNENDTMRVGSYEEDGKFYIVVTKVVAFMVATKHSRKAHVETGYNTFTKSFETKEQANNYFKAIKRNNPSLTRI